MLPTDMGPLPTEHPRSRITELARRDLMEHLLVWQRENDMTFAEQWVLLSGALDTLAQRVLAVERKPK